MLQIWLATNVLNRYLSYFFDFRKVLQIEQDENVMITPCANL